MRKTKDKEERNRALELIKKITVEVEKAKPSKKQMREDVKMMGFKIKSVVGNIFELAKIEAIFLEPLWRIGKIEQIVLNNVNQLNKQEKEILFQYLKSLEKRLEKNFYTEDLKETAVFELEVLKERLIRKRRVN